MHLGTKNLVRNNLMRWINLPRKPLAKAIGVVVVAGGIGVSAPTVYAATAAGTQIKNLATVTYEDAAGNVFSAQSNEAIVTVAQVYSATLGVDVDVSAAPGQTVYLPYVLTNTGNGADTFNLTAIDGITDGDSLDASNITIFEDINGSGEPDAGEPTISSITLPANVGNIANLVVAVEVPAGASDGQTLGVTLTAEALEGGTAAVANSVTDLTAGGGRDTLDGTNESLITVTGDAVLVTTKSSVHDVANNQITYTVSVRNNGNSPANDVVIFDGLPANTTLESFSASGILASNNDTVASSGQLDESSILSLAGIPIDLNADGDTSDLDEAALGLDLNNDGDTGDTGINGVYAIDSVLPPQTAVSLTFTISYDPAALGGGYVIENQGFASGDTNEDGNPDTLTSSNVRQDVVNPNFGVVIADTGTAASPAVNDGGDDDGTANDDQFVDQISAGGTVVFTSIVSNNGNADDIFELSVNPGNFPAGTVFTFFDASGNVQLSDSNGSGVDTGVIVSGGSKTIIIKAQLPASASGAPAAPATEYEATVTVVSANDPASVPASDTTLISLATIVTAASDLHNTANGAIGTDEDPLGTAPYTAANAYIGNAGGTVNIPLYIDNESGGADSYVLSVGSVFDGTTLGSLPAGWTVEFFIGDDSGNPTGAPITSTPLLPGLTLDFEIIAVVSIPADGIQAVNNFVADNDGDGVADTLDANNDGDGDYALFFQILSQNTGATDTVLDGVDVDSERELTLVTPGSNQIEAGGTVTYGHTLANNGNVDEEVVITASNNQPGWTNSISIDTDGDGVADTALSALVPGQITVLQTNGTTVTVTVSDEDGDGIAEQFTLVPGVSLPISASVFAPANATVGQTDTLTVTVTNVDTAAGAPTASVTDQTTVVTGAVRLNKSVAADLDCDGAADTGFDAVQATEVAPGQCAIWRVVAVNQGSSDASNVIISDSIPAFSSYEAGSLRYCLSNGCLIADGTVSDAADGDVGEITGSNIVFYAGDSANPAASGAPGDPKGGVLVPGEQATAQFSVRVQ